MSTQGTRRRRSGSKAGSLAGKSLKISTEQKIKIAKQGNHFFAFEIMKRKHFTTFNLIYNLTTLVRASKGGQTLTKTFINRRNII